jgi:hypothetical protein
MTKDNIQAQKATLFGDFCQIFIQEIEDRMNTPLGFRVTHRIQVKFFDYRYQYRFDLLQSEYEKQFQRVLDDLPDSEMEFPAYIPQSWQQFWKDSEKAGRAMNIMGPSPQNYLDKILLFGKKTILDVETKTEYIPEIIPAE